LYWGQVAKLELEHIQELYWESSEEEKMKELINQIYFYSKTATQKFEHVKASIYILFIAIIVLVLAVFLKLILL
jgi:hypothetical protein